MKHKHRQVSRRQPIQALRKCTWAGWKAGGRDGWESATKAWNGEKSETKRDEKVGREERARRRCQRFSCFTMQFLKLILHIDCSDIHNLWLTFTVCFGWLDENLNAISCVNPCNSNIILLRCDLHSFQPLTFLMALFSYSLKCLL